MPTQSQMKRRWLLAVQSPKPEQLNESFIREALTPIRSDRWVATACVALLDSAADGYEPTVSSVMTLLDVGLRRTSTCARQAEQQTDCASWASAHVDAAATLVLRRALVRSHRVASAWHAIREARAGETSSNEDPWGEEESGSAARLDGLPSLATFTHLSPLEAFVSLSLQPEITPDLLALFLSSLHPLSASEIFPHRQTLLALVLKTGADPKQLAKAALLPIVDASGSESGLWLDVASKQLKEEEVTDSPSVLGALVSVGLLDKSTAVAAPHATRLSAAAVADFYHQQVLALESNGLAGCAMSLAQYAAGLHIPGAEMMSVLGEDLGFVISLQARSRWPPSRTKTPKNESGWDLADLRALSNSDSGRSEVVLSMLGRSTSEVPEALTARILPYLQAMGTRGLLNGDVEPDEGIHDSIGTSLMELVLSLYDEADNYLPSLRSSSSSDPLHMVQALIKTFNTERFVHLLPEGRGTLVRLILALAWGSKRSDDAGLAILSSLIATVKDDASGMEDSETVDLDSLCRLIKDTSSTSTYRAIVRSSLSPIGPAAPPDLLPVLLESASEQIRSAQALCRWSSGWPPHRVMALAEDSAGSQRDCVRTLARSASQAREAREWLRMADDLTQLTRHRRQALHALNDKEVLSTILSAILFTGNVPLFRSILSASLASGSSAKLQSYFDDHELEQLVLNVAREKYDSAPSTNLHSEDMKVAYDTLTAISSTAALTKERSFIEATSRLHSFRLSVKGGTLRPVDMRSTVDRLELIRRLLSAREDAYRTPDLMLELAHKLSVGGGGHYQSIWGEALESGSSSKASKQVNRDINAPPRAVVEIRALAMLVDAAIGAGDLAEANKFCERLVTAIAVMRKRAHAAEASTDASETKKSPFSSSSSSSSSSSAAALLPNAQELGWKACFQVAKHPGWEDDGDMASDGSAQHLSRDPSGEARLRLMGHVLSLCPAERLGPSLSRWRELDTLYAAYVERNGGPSISISPAGPVGSGHRGDAASLTSSFSALFASAGLTAHASRARARLEGLAGAASSSVAGVRSSSTGSGTASRGSPAFSATPSIAALPPSRAAALFDGLGENMSRSSSSQSREGHHGSSGWDSFDPAERAARAARSFFGGLSGSASPAFGGGSGRGTPSDGGAAEGKEGGEKSGSGAGFSLSRGMGWLIGEEEKR